MAVSPANNGAARQAPLANAQQAPKGENKQAQDNTAARQSPGETKTAVNNAFGKVPRPPAGESKDAAPRTNNLATGTPPPADPRVQSILDTKRPDGKSVKEKLDADAPAYLFKAAQDHYNKQKENGEPLDNVSRFYLNNAAKNLAANGDSNEKVAPEKLAGVFNTAQIDKNLEEITKDPGFLKWTVEQQANAIEDTIRNNPDIAQLVQPYLLEGENNVNALRRMQSDYLRSQEFADGVAKAKDGKELISEGLKTLASLGLTEKELLGVGNTLAENIRGKVTPDAPRPVIDPNTNKPVQTDEGNSLSVLPDGTYVSLDKDGKPVADKHGNAWVYNQDGTAKLDANNAYVQYNDKASATFASYGGTWFMTGPDGKGKVDTQGRPLAIDHDAGVPVAIDNGKTVVNKAGNKLVFDPATGKVLTDPGSGNAAVIDPETNGIVQTDAAGNIIAARNGDPYAVDPSTGKFLTDRNGQYVLISKDNVAPGIVPGYIIDRNNTRVVVDPYKGGKPLADPSTGKTVILDPKTNKPQVVPLDANGIPRVAADGKGITYDETGNTIVPNEGKGPNWLVDANGNYMQNDKGSFIGVDPNSGLVAPVDENGFIKNASGLVPLWDTRTNAPMASKDGYQVAADEEGNLLLANGDGTTVIEEKTSLPYLLDPKTKEAAVNPDTGRSILLDKSGLPVEYNADDGYKYLINPETKTTVKTADGNAVTTDDNGLPYAVKQDGSAVKNPNTGNIVAYGFDGLPAMEQSTDYPIEITSSGKAHVIDPKTNTPMAERDPKTGGYQLFNPDGSDAVNPDTGNRIQMVPDSGLKVEIDPKTNRPVTNVVSNPLVMGPDNRPLKTPDGKAVVADLKSGLPVSADTNGNLVTVPAAKLPQVVDPETGKVLADPQTSAPVVADPKSRNPVQVDNNGKIITDPVTGMPVAVNTSTGAQIKGPDGALAVNEPRTGLPVVYDKNSKLFTVVDPDTGKAATDPKTGAKTVVDYGTGLTFNVLPDVNGNHLIVDENGLPVKDDKGNQPYFDKATGKAVIVNVRTGKTPEDADPKNLVYTMPLLMMGPPAIAMMATGKPSEAGPPDDGTDPDEILPDSTTDTTSPDNPATPLESTATDRPWEKPGYTMTPEERAAFIEQWNKDYVMDPFGSYDVYAKEVQVLKQNNPALQGIPDAELAAVRGYTSGPWWEETNKALYSGDPDLLQKYDLYIKAVKSGLTHLQEAGFIYQGPSLRYLNLTPAQFSSMFSNGGIYTNQQFLSTSNLKNETFAARMNTQLKVNHLKGVDIEMVSDFPEQKEILGPAGVKYAVSNVKPAGTRGGLGSLFKIRKINKATLTELPAGFGTVKGGVPDINLPASNWARVSKVLGYAAEGLAVLAGGASAVFGGFQIDDGIKNHNPFDIAAGSVNVASGALEIGSSIASLAGSAAAAPLAVVGIVFGGIAGLIDFVGSLDDDEQYADKLDKEFGPLGILNEGWRPKAQEAYKEGNEKHMGPDYTA